MITFVGDVHGKFDKFTKILQAEKNVVVQVGDLGIGFSPHNDLMQHDFRFIHGNHDNPDLCAKLPNFLGRFGYNDQFFFVSGGYSIDKKYRHIGLDWWDSEELSYNEGLFCIELYEATKPEIVVSHDCPISVYPRLFSHHAADNTKTNNLLQAMFEIHQPALWVFGHHHISRRFNVSGTNFVCLAELETNKI